MSSRQSMEPSTFVRSGHSSSSGSSRKRLVEPPSPRHVVSGSGDDGGFNGGK